MSTDPTQPQVSGPEATETRIDVVPAVLDPTPSESGDEVLVEIISVSTERASGSLDTGVVSFLTAEAVRWEVGSEETLTDVMEILDAEPDPGPEAALDATEPSPAEHYLEEVAPDQVDTFAAEQIVYE